VPTAGDSVTVTSGTVAVNADITVQDFELDGGTLSGSGTLTMTKELNWTAGGMRGSGRTVIGPEARLYLANGGAVGMSQWVLENAGQVLWTGSGNLECNDGAVLTNRVGALWEARNDQSFVHVCCGDGHRFDNAGTFRKTASTGTSSFSGAFAFNNYGTLSIWQGTLSFGSGLYLDPKCKVEFGFSGMEYPANYGRITTTQPLQLAGWVAATLRNGFMPGFSNRFQVITCGSRSGTFHGVSSDPLTRGNYLRAEYLADGMDLVSPPVIRIRYPKDGSYVRASTNLTITTEVPDTAVVRVNFLLDGQKIGTATTPPFSFAYPSIAEGVHTLTAEAIDSGGVTTSAAPVTFTAIIRNFAAQEIDQLQAWLKEIGLSSQVFDQGLKLEALKDFELLIWDDLSYQSGGISDNEVLIFQAALDLGIPLYYIGDDLAYSTINLSAPAQALWKDLLHLNDGPNPASGDLVILEPHHPLLDGPFGRITTLEPDNDPDAALATGTGETVIARIGPYPFLLAFESADSGVRSITQNVLAVRGSDLAQERALFLNAVAWLGVESWPFPRVLGHAPQGPRWGYFSNSLDHVVLSFNRWFRVGPE
jgi:hypothetical protein